MTPSRRAWACSQSQQDRGAERQSESAHLHVGGGLSGSLKWDAADAEASLLDSHRRVLPLFPRRLPRLLRAPPPADAGRAFAGPQEGCPGAGEARPR